jgi:PAT family beta-lactamase induction signal transducer AmpG
VALVTYMSSLTSLGYTATQYALLSASYTWLGKILKGFSGQTVDMLAQGRVLMDAYAIFFTGAAAIGLPALMFLHPSSAGSKTGPTRRAYLSSTNPGK